MRAMSATTRSGGSTLSVVTKWCAGSAASRLPRTKRSTPTSRIVAPAVSVTPATRRLKPPRVGNRLRDTTGRRRHAAAGLECEARTPVRAHRRRREGAGGPDEAREGDRRAHGQQGARAVGRGEDLVAVVARGHLVGSPRRPSLRNEPAEGPHEGAAL